MAAADVLPRPEKPFAGVIGRTLAESTPAPLDLVQAPHGAPNILVVLLDDVGFGQMGTFGGLTPTPALDRLASEGLVYNRFHSTAMCTPTRAAMLTGRNPHLIGNGAVTDFATGFPGYNSMWPIARLVPGGGVTAMDWPFRGAPWSSMNGTGSMGFSPTITSK